MWRLAALIAVFAVGCSSVPGSVASGSRTSSPASGPRLSSPTAGATAAPSPVPHSKSTFAVLVDLFAGPDTYDLSIVASDGRVVASAHPHKRTPIPHALELPYVNTSNSGVYYLDGDSDLHYLRPDGTTHLLGTFPSAPSIRAAFAVTPDDSRIALGLLDFRVLPVKNTLYVTDFDSLSQVAGVIYTSTTRYFWPVGWHAGNLVAAYLGPTGTPFDTTERYGRGVAADFPYGPNPYGGINVHVINSKTAARLAIISGGGQSGLLTKAGSAVTQGDAVNWKGQWVDWRSPTNYGSYNSPGSLAPSGGVIAACCYGPSSSGQLALWFPGDREEALPVPGSGADWVGWFDDTLLITGYYHSFHGTPTVVDIDAGVVKVVQAHGIVAAMLPAGLG
jgi:hypothetical protein